MRLSASSFAGTARTLVAVGTVSDCCMFFAIAAAAPRIGLTCSPATGFTGVALAAAAGAGLPVLGSPEVDAGVRGGAVLGADGRGGEVRSGGAPETLTWPLTLAGCAGFVAVPATPAARTVVETSVAALPVGCATLSPTPAARCVGL